MCSQLVLVGVACTRDADMPRYLVRPLYTSYVDTARLPTCAAAGLRRPVHASTLRASMCNAWLLGLFLARKGFFCKEGIKFDMTCASHTDKETVSYTFQIVIRGNRLICAIIGTGGNCRIKRFLYKR